MHVWIGHLAAGVVLTLSPAAGSFAQATGSGAIGSSASERQFGSGLRRDMGLFLAAPTGRVWVGPATAAGEPIYVRRTTAGAGITVVEVSTTPFVTVANAAPGPTAASTLRPDQPAGW